SASIKDFFRLVKIGFSAKRKMLKNNLANGYHISHKEAENRLKKADFNPKIRAQELSINDWVGLFGEFM
ncbi:MAG: 16S rRNA (adenine(1518)-N(6)/adenine(1519)-N(6))-dimethyltransferase, partial [Patescibacteria group bacterium]|nr:16S rRNA (adenine(1518)-N(6)/adenine(1519)-N(6))-dimethyltransferase [Patescibacteria group bacterium]